MRGMGLTIRLPALLRQSRPRPRSLPARQQGFDLTPIFDTLARAYGGYEGLIGWAFEDHTGPISTAWTTLCAALDHGTQTQADPVRQTRRPERPSLSTSRNRMAAPTEVAATPPVPQPRHGETPRAGDADTGTESSPLHAWRSELPVSAPAQPATYTAPTWRSSRWRPGPSTSSRDSADPTAH